MNHRGGYHYIEEMFGPYDHLTFGGAMTDDRAFELHRRRSMNLQQMAMLNAAPPPPPRDNPGIFKALFGEWR